MTMYAHVEDASGRIVALGEELGEPTEGGQVLVELTPEQEAALTPVPSGHLYLKDGLLVVAPPWPLAPSYDQREREEALGALDTVDDIEGRVEVLQRMTVGKAG
jgi:hypothetical protein